MMERGSAAILASQVVHFDSLINRDITEQRLRAISGGGGSGECIKEAGVGCCRVFWVMGLQIHRDGEFN